jgi:hypothetical protein
MSWYKTTDAGRAAVKETTPARVADHVESQRGDFNKFTLGELQSLCKPCHDGRKARIERIGFQPDVDVQGWPIDPAHPTNVRLREQLARVRKSGSA